VLIASRVPLLARLVPLCAAVAALIAFGKTGSRGGLIAFAALIVAHLWGSSFANKIRWSIALAIALVLTPLVLPDYIRARFLTFFNADESSEYGGMLQGNDVASTTSRTELTAQAMRLTIEHPIFGIGPGEFGDVSYKRFRAGQGIFINHAIHNSYLQISCEAGVPALLLFAAGLLVCFRQTRKLPAPAEPRGRQPTANDSDKTILHYTRCGLIFICVFALTLSFAYDDILLLAMAMMTAATNAVAHRRATHPAMQPAVAPMSQRVASPLWPAAGLQTALSRRIASRKQ